MLTNIKNTKILHIIERSGPAHLSPEEEGLMKDWTVSTGRCWAGNHRGRVLHQASKGLLGCQLSPVTSPLEVYSIFESTFLRYKNDPELLFNVVLQTTRMHPRNLSHRVSKIVY